MFMNELVFIKAKASKRTKILCKRKLASNFLKENGKGHKGSLSSTGRCWMQ